MRISLPKEAYLNGVSMTLLAVVLLAGWLGGEIDSAYNAFVQAADWMQSIFPLLNLGHHVETAAYDARLLVGGKLAIYLLAPIIVIYYVRVISKKIIIDWDGGGSTRKALFVFGIGFVGAAYYLYFSRHVSSSIFSVVLEQRYFIQQAIYDAVCVVVMALCAAIFYLTWNGRSRSYDVND